MLLSSFLVLKVLVFAIAFVDQIFFVVEVAANLHKGISVLPGLLSSAGGEPGRSLYRFSGRVMTLVIVS